MTTTLQSTHDLLDEALAICAGESTAQPTVEHLKAMFDHHTALTAELADANEAAREARERAGDIKQSYDAIRAHCEGVEQRLAAFKAAIHGDRLQPLRLLRSRAGERRILREPIHSYNGTTIGMMSAAINAVQMLGYEPYVAFEADAEDAGQLYLVITAIGVEDGQ